MNWAAKFEALLRPWQSPPDEVAHGALANAYLTLLRMPHTGVRARSQPALAALRDCIAAEFGKDPEDTQVFFEYWAEHGGPPPDRS